MQALPPVNFKQLGSWPALLRLLQASQDCHAAYQPEVVAPPQAEAEGQPTGHRSKAPETSQTSGASETTLADSPPPLTAYSVHIRASLGLPLDAPCRAAESNSRAGADPEAVLDGYEATSFTMPPASDHGRSSEGATGDTIRAHSCSVMSQLSRRS